MLRILTIGSSSSGNGYILESDNQILIVELGCRFKEYSEAIRGRFENVVGCVISHQHQDHMNISTVNEFIRRGIPVYVGKEVGEIARQTSLNVLITRQKTHLGRFIIQSFEIPHNVPNYGFLIQTPTQERVVFITDTMGVSLRFKDLDCIMCECNYDEDILLENMEYHTVSSGHPEYHMSLEACAAFCQANLTASTKQIMLLHPSGGNLDEHKALKYVKSKLSFDNVCIAHKGDVCEIENDNW